MSTSDPSGLLKPFAEIDRIIRGDGFASPETVERTHRYQQALGVDPPLSHQAASALLARPATHIALFTGFVVPELFPQGENDGPLGTVALARALQRIGFASSVYVDRELVDTTRWIAAEIGCDVPVAAIDPDAEPPKCDIAIAIEKPGVNSAGILHTYDGRRIEGGSTPVDDVFAAMRGEEILTLALGDIGNEVGFGRLHDLVSQLLPTKAACRCGCGGGIAAVTATDLLYPAAVSNWGAYGLAAALAVRAGVPKAALLPEEEARMLRVAAVRGCRDGVKRQGAYGVDGVAGEASVRLVEALWALVERGT